MKASGAYLKGAEGNTYRPPLKSRWIGTASAMLSAIIFGFNPLMAQSAYRGGSNDIAFIFYSTVIALPVLAVMMKMLRIPFLPEKKQIKGILATGLFGAVTTMLLFCAYNYVATGIATTLHFTYPTFVAIGSVLILSQKLTKGKVGALLLSLCGIALAADFSGSANMLGIVLALTSGLTYALYILLMDKTGLKYMHFIRACFYFAFIKAVVSGIYGGVSGKLVIRMNGMAVGMTVLLGLLATIGAVVLFQIGVRYAGPSNAAIFSMLEPVTSLIVGFLFMNESMAPAKIAGCLLILSGIVLTVGEERKAKTAGGS